MTLAELLANQPTLLHSIDREMGYLNMETSQSHEWVGRAIKEQAAAKNHTATKMAMAVFETFWLPRCTKIQSIECEIVTQIKPKQDPNPKKDKPLTSKNTIWTETTKINKIECKGKNTSLKATGIICRNQWKLFRFNVTHLTEKLQRECLQRHNHKTILSFFSFPLYNAKIPWEINICMHIFKSK